MTEKCLITLTREEVQCALGLGAQRTCTTSSVAADQRLTSQKAYIPDQQHAIGKIAHEKLMGRASASTRNTAVGSAKNGSDLQHWDRYKRTDGSEAILCVKCTMRGRSSGCVRLVGKSKEYRFEDDGANRFYVLYEILASSIEGWLDNPDSIPEKLQVEMLGYISGAEFRAGDQARLAAVKDATDKALAEGKELEYRWKKLTLEEHVMQAHCTRAGRDNLLADVYGPDPVPALVSGGGDGDSSAPNSQSAPKRKRDSSPVV